METHRRERYEWNVRTLGGAYDKVGKKDPRWDRQAREAFRLTARMFGQQVDPEINSLEVHEATQAAVDAGCDDPLLLYVHTRTAIRQYYPGEAKAIQNIKAAAKNLAASDYPVIRRAMALQIAATDQLSAKELTATARQDAEHDLDSALALLPDSVAKDERNEFWEVRWLDTLIQSIRGYRTLGQDAPKAYERVDAKLEKIPELKVLRLQLRGRFWYLYGWEARTTAFAPNVPQGGFEALESRTAIGRKAFEEAWQLRHDSETAGWLLDIEKAVGGDRATMELWFDRAMKADGDNQAACLTKLDWLDPKWHGTPEEMLAFGSACRDTRNWYAGITLLLADAHLRILTMLSQEDRKQYMKSPKVWPDLQSVFEEYLKHHPNDAAARSKYAMMSYFAAQYRLANRQFQTLGDDLTVWPIFPNYPLATMKRVRDEVASVVSRMPPEEETPGDKKNLSPPQGEAPASKTDRPAANESIPVRSEGRSVPPFALPVAGLLVSLLVLTTLAWLFHRSPRKAKA